MKRFLTLCAAAMTFAVGNAWAYTSLLQLKMDFEQPAGDTVMADSSGNGRIGYLLNGAATTDAGHTGRGLALDGTDDKMKFDDVSGWDIDDGLTVCGWVNTANDGVLLERGSYIRPFALIINSSGSITWAVATLDSGDTRYTSGPVFTFNQWHHVAGVYSAAAGSSYIYLDGALVKSGPLTGRLANRNDAYTWTAGCRNNRTWLQGTIDDLRVYSRAVPPGEISDIYNGTETDADTEAPTVPQNVTATAVSPREVRVSWDPSTDNTRVWGYRIYKDGVHLATTYEAAASWSAYWLRPETQYSFTVSAVDNDSNESAQSAAASVTTAAETYPDYYVGGGNILTEMDKITPACMETLRTKHVFGYTKSWGGSMTSGYGRLNSDGSPYYLTTADIGTADSADVASYNIIKADTTRYPETFRVEALGTTLGNWLAPHVDAAFIFWSQMGTDNVGRFNTYAQVFDSLRAAYPDIAFIYATGGLVGEYDLDKTGNINVLRFNEMLINRYRGEVPLYDMSSLMAVTGVADTGMFPMAYADYSSETKADIGSYVEASDRVLRPDTTWVLQTPASGLHPDAAGEKRMALGFTLTLAKVFCSECFPQTASVDTAPHSWVTDSLAVQAILDANGITSVSVEGVVEEKTPSGRVSSLSLRDPNLFTLTTLPGDIGDLDSLTTLYVYSNELTSLPPEIGNLTMLDQLNISENNLSSLPASIGNLTRLRQLTMNDNLFTDLPEQLLSLTNLVDNYGIILDNNSICDTAVLSTGLLAFVNAKSSGWLAKQDCGSGVAPALVSAPQLPFRIEHTDAALTVRWEPGTVMDLALYGTDGHKVDACARMSGGEASLDVRSAAPGLYLLRLRQGERTHTVKVTIIK